MPPFIEIKGLRKYYGNLPNRQEVLKGVDLSIGQGEWVAIMGASGSGKSTLMNVIGGLDTYDEGSYLVHNTRTAMTTQVPPSCHMEAFTTAAQQLRQTLFGFIFQRYNLIGTLSLVDNVILPSVYCAAPEGQSRLQRHAQAVALLASLGISEWTKKPSELSGGQQQRVAIARALMNNVPCLLADEPTGALDSKTGEQVIDLLETLHKQGKTVIMVTHDPLVARRADRVITLKDGQVISDTGPCSQASHPPARPEKQLALVRPFWIQDLVAMSLGSVINHKLRSALTVLGIVIGIAAVVCVMALGSGSKAQIMANVNSFGTNTIEVMPGATAGDRQAAQVDTLTVADAQALLSLKAIKEVSANVTFSTYGRAAVPLNSAPSVRDAVQFQSASKTVQLRGVSRTYAVLKNLKLASGRWFLNDGEVVLDANAVAEFFPKTEPHTVVGQSVVLGTTVWKVVGVLEASKAGFQDSSLGAYLDVDQLRSRLQRGKGVSSLTLGVADDVSSQEVEQFVIKVLRERHGGVSDVHTRNSDTFKATVSSTLSTMTLFVSAIALISLVVGGVGVMNIMLVSVTERTREIGVRLAVGARKKDILQQFLLEAMLLCTAGGLLGVALSAMLAGAYNSVVHQFPMSIDPAVAAAAVLFSTCLGLAFGIMPARKAASTVPVDALNHS